MANETNLIQPAANAQPQVTIEPAAGAAPAGAAPAEEAQGAELPEDFLRLPSAGPLLAGSPPAMSLKIKDMAKTEDGKIIAKSASALQSAGVFFYRALDKETGVIGNSLYVNPEAVKQADEQGQLASLAPDWNMVGGEASRAGAANPVMTAGAPPEAAATAPAPAPPQMSAGTMLPPPPASTQTKLAGARARNLQPGSPTSGPTPGRGRILSNLLKPAI